MFYLTYNPFSNIFYMLHLCMYVYAYIYIYVHIHTASHMLWGSRKIDAKEGLSPPGS